MASNQEDYGTVSCINKHWQDEGIIEKAQIGLEAKTRSEIKTGT